MTDELRRYAENCITQWEDHDRYRLCEGDDALFIDGEPPMVRLAREIKRLNYDLQRNKDVIGYFYHVLGSLGICPSGIYTWCNKDAKRFAKAIFDKATSLSTKIKPQE